MSNTADPMLIVRDLHASIEETEILKGLNLTVNAGEIHAIMGPNGSGKSTLANVIAGRPGYKVTGGEILFHGANLVEMTSDARARAGIFLAFQYPVELPGVRNWQFVKAAVDAIRDEREQPELKVREFDRMFNEQVKAIDISPELMRRSVNEGFSGGEKKRSEMFQFAMLEPKLAVLDETDSGLDIDALRAVANTVNDMREPERAMIVVTHYQRILSYITPSFVHILMDGRIVRSGGPGLAEEVEDKGYEWVTATADSSAEADS